MIKPTDRTNEPAASGPSDDMHQRAGRQRRIIIPGEPLTSEPATSEPGQDGQREVLSSGGSAPRSPKPPRGAKWRTLFLVLLGAAVVFTVGTLWGEAVLSGSRQAWQKITGTEAAVSEDDAAAGAAGVQYWTCGMHPWVILPASGLCPICHMDLTPLDPAKLAGEIAIDPVVVQNIGVRVAPVTTGPLTKEIRTIGTVNYDETATRDVNTKISGWIEELYVDETGAAVQQGDPLFDLYSPELYQAQEEYLLALQGKSRLTRDLLEGARTKLQFLDVGPAEIRELEQRGTAEKTLTVTSPHTGVVVEKNAHEGMKIDPGTLVYRIADLSSVWVIATLYEYQLPYVEVGQPAVMTLPYLPGETFKGKVAYIYPFLQQASRQVKVRLEFPNPDGQLKPGMFATLQLQNTIDQQAVLAPREAIISTGTRQVAFVSSGEGKFEPRDVELGVETEQGLVQILDGLKPGERVVTSGQFLLDSESKMRAALAKMVQGDMASEQPSAAAEVAEATRLAELPPAAVKELSDLLRAYVAIGDSLAADSTSGIQTAAEEIPSSLDALLEVPLPGQPDFWKKSMEAATMRGKAIQLAEVKGLDAARMIYASLSQAFSGLLEETGVPLSYGERIEALTCPMYPPKVGGAVWLQPAGKARNPYMGPSMLRCVGQRAMLPVAGGGAENMAAEGLEVAASVQQQVDQLTVSYLALQQLLFENQMGGSEEALQSIRHTALELAETEYEELRSAAAEVAQSALRQPEDLAKMRAAFKSLSAAMVELVAVVPPSTETVPELRMVFCPMAEANWLQVAAKIQNPYYGQGHEMADCGTIEEIVQT